MRCAACLFCVDGGMRDFCLSLHHGLRLRGSHPPSSSVLSAPTLKMSACYTQHRLTCAARYGAEQAAMVAFTCKSGAPALMTDLAFTAGSPPSAERAVATDEDAQVVTVCSPPAHADASDGGGEGEGGFTPGLLTDTPPEGARCGAAEAADPGSVRQALMFALEDDAHGQARSGGMRPLADAGGPALLGSPGGEEHAARFAWAQPAARPPPGLAHAAAPDLAHATAAPGALEHHGACIVRLPAGVDAHPNTNPCTAVEEPHSGRPRGIGGEALPGPASSHMPGLAPGAPASPSAAASGSRFCDGWAVRALSPGEELEAGAESGGEEGDGDEDAGGGGGPSELQRDESIEETLVGSFCKLAVSPPGSPVDPLPAALGAPSPPARGGAS